MVFRWSLSDSKILPGLFWVFQSILIRLWSGRSWFFLWFSVPLYFSRPLGTILSAPTTNGVTSVGTAKPTKWWIVFFLLINFGSGFQAEIRCSVYISKSQGFLCVSFSRTDSGWCRYQLVESNFNLLHNSKMISFPTQSCHAFLLYCIFLS